MASICCSPPDKTDADILPARGQVGKAIIDGFDVARRRRRRCGNRRPSAGFRAHVRLSTICRPSGHQNELAAQPLGRRQVGDVFAVEADEAAGAGDQALDARAAASSCRRRWSRAR